MLGVTMNIANRCSIGRLSSNLVCLCRRTHTYMKRKVDLDFDIHAGLSTNYDLAPIVVSHGLFSNKKEWTQSCKELNLLTSRKVICYDAVNHGCSSQHTSMSYFALAHDLHMILEELNIQKKVIHLGHRMGGKSAGTLALVKPEKVSHLVIIDSAPSVRRECLLGDTTTALQRVLDADISAFESKEEIREEIEKLSLTPLLTELVLNNVVAKAGGGFKMMCNLQSVMENYDELIAFPPWRDEVAYHGPTLFIGDIERETEDIVSINKRFPNAFLHHVEDISYNIHIDTPKDILGVISNFLGNKSSKSDVTKNF